MPILAAMAVLLLLSPPLPAGITVTGAQNDFFDGGPRGPRASTEQITVLVSNSSTQPHRLAVRGVELADNAQPPARTSRPPLETRGLPVGEDQGPTGPARISETLIIAPGETLLVGIKIGRFVFEPGVPPWRARLSLSFDSAGPATVEVPIEFVVPVPPVLRNAH